MKGWTNYYTEMVSRNIGVITEEEQEILRRSTVAIAGCGGMGGLSALWACQIGIGSIKIADPETFEVSNINRQLGASRSTIGMKKVDVIKSILSDMNPEVKIKKYPEGITPKNSSRFVENSDIVIDAIDYNNLSASLNLHRDARKAGLYIYYAVAIGFGANLFIFSPNGMTIEEYIGLSSNTNLEEFNVPLDKFCPVIPSYADMDVVKKAALGQTFIPNIGLAQALGTGMTVGEVVLKLLNKREPITVPNFISFDIAEYRLFTKSK